MAQLLATADRPIVDGTPANDRIYGSPGDDTLRGYAGNDRLQGRGGNDLLEGGMVTIPSLVAWEPISSWAEPGPMSLFCKLTTKGLT